MQYSTQRMPSLRPSESQITITTERTHFSDVLRNMWNIPSSVTHFPAPHPVSLERRHFGHLNKDTVVSLKTDGVRYLLMLCVDRQNEPVALMIDRAMKMYEIEVWANNEFFEQGTLFDGELVWENEGKTPRLTYIVFDAVCISGESCIRNHYSTRLNKINRVIGDLPHDVDESTAETLVNEQNCIFAMRNPYFLRLRPKKCVRLNCLSVLWNNRHECPHRNDGLILTRNDAPLDINTSSCIWKWKSNHTVDVLVEEGIPYVQLGAACEPLLKLRRGSTRATELDVVFVTNEVCDSTATGVVVECECSVTTDTLKLFPLKRRFDKTSPNSLTTLERTLTNILENIGIQELIDEFEDATHEKRQKRS